MQAARAEALYIFTNALDALFASTKIKPTDIDILVVNWSAHEQDTGSEAKAGTMRRAAC
jgi:hypothetical protein